MSNRSLRLSVRWLSAPFGSEVRSKYNKARQLTGSASIHSANIPQNCATRHQTRPNDRDQACEVSRMSNNRYTQVVGPETLLLHNSSSQFIAQCFFVWLLSLWLRHYQDVCFNSHLLLLSFQSAHLIITLPPLAGPRGYCFFASSVKKIPNYSLLPIHISLFTTILNIQPSWSSGHMPSVRLWPSLSMAMSTISIPIQHLHKHFGVSRDVQIRVHLRDRYHALRSIPSCQAHFAAATTQHVNPSIDPVPPSVVLGARIAPSSAW